MSDVIFRDNKKGRWLLFREPVKIVATRQLHEVRPCLDMIESAVERDHVCAAGFLSYEAGAAFDPAFPIRKDAEFPLLWFGLFKKVETREKLDSGEIPPLVWTPDVSFEDYRHTINRIHQAIQRGETYQVNYTFPFKAPLNCEPEKLFRSIVATFPSTYAAFIDTEDFSIASFSPELFFERNGSRLVSCPMKGTAARGRSFEEDEACAQRLQTTPKERAENVMIVDMIRNDMGRIAQTGSVCVERLFEVQRLPTVLQMTSTVSCKTDASLAEVFGAMFPCASITGAPKANTMRLIHELEPEPRRIYTGTIGYLEPGKIGTFNVAIRTILANKRTREMKYGVGGGITWDSTAENEYQECVLKARKVSNPMPAFKLLETMLWTPEEGYFLLNEHLARLELSAKYFQFIFDAGATRAYLQAIKPGVSSRVRMTVDSNGVIAHTVARFDGGIRPEVRLKVAPAAINSNNVFLYHKTTNRDFYPILNRGDCDDWILWNERGEVTETTIGNLVFEKSGEFVTPALQCGLLPGTFRKSLLEQGKVKEDIVKLSDLGGYEKVYRVNSVRKWESCKIE